MPTTAGHRTYDQQKSFYKAATLLRLHTIPYVDSIITMEQNTSGTPMSATNKKWMDLAVPLAIIIAGILIAVGIFLGLFLGKHSVTNQCAGQQQQQAAQPTTADPSKLSGGNDPYIGNPKAPVTIYYFFDYQCPFCKQNELQTMPEILKNYVDTGKVKIVYKDFEFLGPDSITVGEWARAVWQLYPNQFQAWHDAIFQNEGTENSGWVTTANLTKYTQTVPGIDASAIIAAVAKNKAAYDSAMSADKAQAQSVGIQGTPSLVIGNQLVVGALPYSNISAAIDAVIKSGK